MRLQTPPVSDGESVRTRHSAARENYAPWAMNYRVAQEIGEESARKP